MCRPALHPLGYPPCRPPKPPSPDIDWDLLSTAYDDVEFFCSNQALKYPGRYRWRMVAELYAHQKHIGYSAPGITHSNKGAMAFLSSCLASFSDDTSSQPEIDTPTVVPFRE